MRRAKFKPGRGFRARVYHSRDARVAVRFFLQQADVGPLRVAVIAGIGGAFVLGVARQLPFARKDQLCMRERTETVIAAYRPKPGKDSALQKLVRQHRRILDEARLVSKRPTILLRARSDGTVLEIFEWASAKAADEAHLNPSMRAMWSKFAKVADFIPLSAIQESGNAFSHFEALSSNRPDLRTLAAKRPAAQQAKR